MPQSEGPTSCAVRVLGPIEVAIDGKPRDLGGPKARLLLALLLVDLGRVVSTDMLIEGLWAGDVPATARKALQVHVSNLRRALGERFPLRTATGGYLVDSEGIDLDASRFEEAVQRGTRLMSTDPEGARQAFEHALELWAGPAYADVADEIAIEAEAARLNELRLQAITHRIDATLRLGGHAEVIGELDSLTVDHPYREQLQALHMIALYRAGRQADALQAFQRTRRVLDEELGLEPSPELKALERRILQQSADLDLDPGTGAGYAFLATDLEGSTALWEAQPDLMEPALARHDELLGAVVDRHAGRVFQTTGDGLYAVFARASDAIDAAVEAQSVLHREPWATMRPLTARMAVDEGRATQRGGDYFGPVVNRVARLMSAAHGGQVVIPASLADASAVPSVCLGEVDLKGIGRLEVNQLLVPELPTEFPPLRTDRTPTTAPRRGFTQALRGYELRERLGEGAHGIVYRAYQASVGREVAVKVIRPEFANRPDFVKRFEAEAQYVAQLEHPHIVSLYDYWRDPDGAYLAMQWLRGGSLAKALEPGPWRPPAALHLIDQIGSALSYAHRHGVVHRDIKPANVLLDGEGNAFLSDFGIAHDELHDAGSVAESSAAYMAPEQLAGDAPGPAGDIYELALLTYEILTGERPALGAQPPPLGPHHGEAASELDRVIARATHPDPAARYPRVDDFLRALRQLYGADVVTRERRDTSDVRNPYKGLRAFAETDAADFFGRDDTVETLLRMVEVSPITTVVGPSGSGKSSLVKAGLLPAVRRGRVDIGADVLITEMFPGSFPFEELEAALMKVAVDRPDELMADLVNDDRGLLRASKQILPGDHSVLLLVIDQFEELFSLTTDEDIRHRFIANLVTASRDERSRVRLILTIRADFFDRPLEYPDFGELVTDGLVTVAAPSTDDLALAISGPAHQVGLELEPGLVPAITRDVASEPGALPLLQYALTELFSHRDGNLLTLEGYERTGGVHGALSRRAEDIYGGLPPAAKEAARDVFLRLVSVDEDTDDTRRRVRRTELESLGLSESALDAALSEYGSFRLLSFDRDRATRGPTVEVAHEALIRVWPRYRQWVDDRRESLLLERRLEAGATDWHANGRDESYLIGGGRLEQYEQWAASSDVRLTALERDYLDAARRVEHDAGRRAARRRRRVLSALSALAVAAMLLAVLAFVQRGRANEKTEVAEELRAEADRRAAIESARSLATASKVASAEDPQAGMLLALEAYDTASSASVELPDVMEALYESTHRDRVLTAQDTNPVMASLGRGVAVSPDGAQLAVLEGDAGDALPDDSTRAVVVDVRTGEETLRLEEPTGVFDVWWDPIDGGLVTATRDSLSWWDVSSGERSRTLPVGAGGAWGVSGTANLIAYSLLQDRATGASVAVVADRASNQRLLEIPEALQSVISPSERHAVTALLNGDLVIHELPGGREVARISDYRKRSLDITFIKDQEAAWWASASAGGLRRIDLATGEVSERQTPLREVGPSSPQLSADGEWLALGFADGRIAISDVATSQPALELGGHGAAISSISWTGDGTRLVTSDADGEVRVWDLTESRSYVDAAYYDETGIDLRLGSAFYSPALYDGAAYFGLDLGDGGDALPPARRLAVQEDLGLVAVSAGSTVGVFDHEGSLVARLDSGFSEPLGISPDGTILALGIPPEHIGQVGFPQPMFGLVEVDTGEVLHRWPDMSASTAVFSPDGRTVVFAVQPRGDLDFTPSEPSMLRAFDVASGDEVAHLDTGICISQLGYSADGRRLGVAGCNGEVALYDHDAFLDSSDALVGRTAVGGGERLLGLAVSDDGSEVYAGGLDNRITAWSPDGMRELWSIDRGEPTGRLVLRDGWLWTMEAVELLIGSPRNWIGRVAIPVEPSELADFARSKVVRDFTEEECHEYFRVPCASR